MDDDLLRAIILPFLLLVTADEGGRTDLRLTFSSTNDVIKMFFVRPFSDVNSLS